MDIIFIILNLTIFQGLKFRKNLIKYITTSSTSYNLTSINDIYIKEYNVQNFIKMRKKQQFQYILREYKYIEYILTKDQKYLINLINEFRENNNLEKLLFDKIINYHIT